MAHSVAVQKNSNGESGVMMTVPTPSSSEAFSSITATIPALRPRKQHPRGVEQHAGGERGGHRTQQPHPQRGLPQPAGSLP